ncbi:MAG: lipoprotein insertase outer membrane protein LolB [Vibrio sp.]
MALFSLLSTPFGSVAQSNKFNVKHIFTLFLSSLILVLAGCSSVPDTQENYSVDWLAHKDNLEKIEAFKVSGKIGYKDAKQRESLSFVMKHSADYSELKLLSLFGQTVLTVQMSPTGAMVSNSDGEVQTAAKADDLIEKLIGISIPVSQLPDWIKGLPTNADSVLFNESNTVSSLAKLIDHRAWQLAYMSYQSVPTQGTSVEKALGGKNITLPKQMQLQQKDTQVKILITKWIL